MSLDAETYIGRLEITKARMFTAFRSLSGDYKTDIDWTGSIWVPATETVARKKLADLTFATTYPSPDGPTDTTDLDISLASAESEDWTEEGTQIAEYEFVASTAGEPYSIERGTVDILPAIDDLGA